MVLTQIAICLFTSLVTACFVQFYDFCIGEPDGEGGYAIGRIFSKLGAFISVRHQAFDLNHPKRTNFWKAAGVCPLCFSVYASALFTFLSWWLLGLPLWYFFPVAFISMRLVRYFQ